MKKIIQIVVAVVVIASMTGCATPYMTDRGRDAADIFTATVGYGAGAKARIGPLQLGLLCATDILGLRNGSFSDTTIFSNRTRAPVPGLDFDVLLFRLDVPIHSRIAIERHKPWKAESYPWTPILFLPEDGPKDCPVFLTQIEVVLGVGPSLRLGFNPGELLDFILGWTTIDIYSDDLEWTKRKSNK